MFKNSIKIENQQFLAKYNNLTSICILPPQKLPFTTNKNNPASKIKQQLISKFDFHHPTLDFPSIIQMKISFCYLFKINPHKNELFNAEKDEKKINLIT